ncbi:hypothetical protein [Mucilaginibacter aquaedulcis]|uniref:hypothetical protein n=1 Tax=Mucilaginibacter aquaedulcis TaxID=1187081 RepID=UPI0025B2FBB0|nr:hypothetical protein [Mucilaginibacter aquaedulcis]MDN3548747.1 hypothetical protein [Mucilaginibacter aquaedulcis]
MKKGNAITNLTTDRITLVEMISEADGLTAKANFKRAHHVYGEQFNMRIKLISRNNSRLIDNLYPALQSSYIGSINQNKQVMHNESLRKFLTVTRPALLSLNTVLISFTISHR